MRPRQRDHPFAEDDPAANPLVVGLPDKARILAQAREHERLAGIVTAGETVGVRTPPDFGDEVIVPKGFRQHRPAEFRIGPSTDLNDAAIGNLLTGLADGLAMP